MALVTCPNGHRYDNLRNSECPRCRRGNTFDMDATIGAYGTPVGQNCGTLPQCAFPDSELDATVGAYGFSGVAPISPVGHAASEKGSSGDATLPLDFSGGMDDGPTISAHNFGQKKDFSPVTGWFVCIDGAEMGRDFRLYSGRNFAGRSPKMQICIADDPKINREGHFSIVFDPESRGWFIIPGSGTVTYLNGTMLERAAALKDMDIVKAGDSSFAFRSFCGEAFCW